MIKIIDNANLNEMTFTAKAFDTSRKQIVDDIIADVKTRGDKALFELCEKFDDAKLDNLLVSQVEIDNAYSRVPQDFLDIMRQAKQNIEEFHNMQLKKGFEIKKSDGVIVGQRYTAMEKAGVYVPGGTAAYPSSVLMNVIPAVCAGVQDITLCTPTKKGVIKDEILAAAKLCGITRIVKCGGAQAIAAMADGTQSVPKGDVIAGPGNIFVALAKKAVYGDVGIDMIAGPSEILIIADESANANYVACDLLSQAEHDELATSVLVTTSAKLALDVQAELEKELARLPREGIARKSIDNNGLIIVTSSLNSAAEYSNKIAPEHLELYVKEPFKLMEKIRNAGSIFLGGYSPEPLGDYFAGPNHTLPTGGSARFSSPLSVDVFIKKSSYIYYPKDAAIAVADKVAEFASREGLDAHANAILARKD